MSTSFRSSPSFLNSVKSGSSNAARMRIDRGLPVLAVTSAATCVCSDFDSFCTFSCTASSTGAMSESAIDACVSASMASASAPGTSGAVRPAAVP